MAIPSIFQGFPQGNRMRTLLGGDQGLDPGDFGGGDFQRPPPPMPRRNKYIEAAMQNGGQYPGTSPINADPEWLEYQQWFLSRQGGMGRGGGLLGTLANALGMGQQGAQQAGPATGGMPRPVGNRPMTQGPSPAPVQMPQDGTYQAPAPQPGPGTGMPPGLWKGANSGMTFADTVKLDAVKKKKEQLEKQIQSLDEKRNTLFQQAQSLEPPKPQQPVGYRDLLPMLGIGLVAKLLGATDRDLAEGGAGFLQGRGQYAQSQNDYQQQLFKAKQQGLMGQAEIADREFGYASDQLRDAQGRLDKLDDRAYTEKQIQGERDWKSQMAKDDDDRALAKQREAIEAKKGTAWWQGQKAYVLQEAKAIRDDANLTPDQKREALNRLYSRGYDEDIWNDPVVKGAMGGITYANADKAASTETKKLQNEFLSKTMKDRIAIIATKKGLDATKAKILEKDLHYYEADRQEQVALIRARTLAAGRSNAEGMSPTEMRMQTTTIANSTEELLKENMRAIRVALGNPKNAEGKELTDEELEVAIESPQNLPALVGAASTAALWAERKALREQRSKALTDLSKLNGQQSAGKQQKQGGGGPRRQIDTKGGAGALKKPKGNPGWKVEIE